MATGITGTLSPENQEMLDRLMKDVKNKQLQKNQDLGQDAFLKLMMTQLAHQDPLSPMDNQQMIAQMAQFSSVEQMGLMNEGMQKSVKQNDEIIDALLMMASQGLNDESNEKMDTLIEKTNRSNELNTEILSELMKLNKAMNAYE
jgi:hypothetical protein